MTSFPQPHEGVNVRSPEEHRWRVVGRIAGPYLPKTPVRIGNFTIGPLPVGVQVLERMEGLKAAPTNDAHHSYYIGRGGDVEVKSSCYFWIDKVVKLPELAIEIALSEDIPLLQTAFSLRNNEAPYQFEILWATDGSQNCSNFTSIGFLIWRTEEISSIMLNEIKKDHKILSTRDIAQNASHFLANAIRQEAVAGDDVTAREAALLSYFKVIELIATRVGGETPIGREKEQQEVLSRLQAVLNSEKSVSKKISAVQDATTSLSRLEGRYLALKIDAAAKKLKISDDWKRAAMGLAKLRNTRLGHAGSRTQGAEQALVQWSGIAKETGYTALRLAREILMAYVDRSRKDPH